MTASFEVVALREDEWARWRTLRLDASLETPQVLGSTLVGWTGTDIALVNLTAVALSVQEGTRLAARYGLVDAGASRDGPDELRMVRPAVEPH